MGPHGFVLLLLALPESAWAAEPPSMTTALLRTGWALLVVIGLILALYALTKKRLLAGRLGGNAIKIVELRPLLPKATLALVEVRGREYLLGVGPGGIQLLADLSAATSGQQPDFSALLAEQQ